MRKKGLFLLLLLTVLSVQIFAQNRLLFRISVENTANHVQTKAVEKFAVELKDMLGDVLDVRFYHSARLFRDSEAVGAMARGDLEMAVPGTWQLDRYVPEISYLLLPDFFGAKSGMGKEFFGSRMGRELVSRIELNLDVVVPGLWMDLGPAHLFTTHHEISSFDDFSGLRIRVAGGIANKMRVEAFGAEGVIIPWPDLPPRIRDGSVDGVLTTFETIRSAALWKDGIRYAFLDYEYFPQYVPLVSSYAWSRLSSEQRQHFVTIWNNTAEKQKTAAAAAQQEAMAAAVRNGVQINEPQKYDSVNARDRLMDQRDGFIRALGIDQDFIELDSE
ncbi:TRAP transporter substrate-binding protein DctP [Marispirochaeta sp.]|uniref:TRAP transporter substrate-binding protein DctP n=1 Tax=Marispirochaeta sp. TaxID=2038653 RepID=UPI0029C7E444|nr:TRAP transporter substrate-binding protein DctP [Marispirochaeta sp.]